MQFFLKLFYVSVNWIDRFFYLSCYMMKTFRIKLIWGLYFPVLDRFIDLFIPAETFLVPCCFLSEVLFEQFLLVLDVTNKLHCVFDTISLRVT